jgi:outer membrane protein assembly factor BamE (lipoprotein component of BamABCDE complex)
MIKVLLSFFLVGFVSLVSSCGTDAKQLDSKSRSLVQLMTKEQVRSIMGRPPTRRSVRETQEVWYYSSKKGGLLDGYTHQILTFIGDSLHAIVSDTSYGPDTYKEGWIYERRGSQPDSIIEIRNR